MVTKQRFSSGQWKQELPVLLSFVKMQVGRGNIQSSDQNTDYPFIYEIWVTQHPSCFQNISSTNLHLIMVDI